jgi:hypothetical protein
MLFRKEYAFSSGWGTSVNTKIAGWWYTYPSEKHESQMVVLFPTEWKVIKVMFQTTRLT